MGISIFLMILGMNLQYAINNYGILSLNFNPAILASGSGGSGTEEPNYAWSTKLVSEDCPVTVVNGEFTIIYKGVTIGPRASYEHDGSRMNCNFWPFTQCDQNKVVDCHLVN